MCANSMRGPPHHIWVCMCTGIIQFDFRMVVDVDQRLPGLMTPDFRSRLLLKAAKRVHRDGSDRKFVQEVGRGSTVIHIFRCIRLYLTWPWTTWPSTWNRYRLWIIYSLMPSAMS